MAKTTEITKGKAETLSLPIFRKVQDLCSLMADVQREIPKQYKHTLGDRMLDSSLNMMRVIFTINRSEKFSSERLMHMGVFTDEFDFLKSLVRICEEKRIITTKRQAAVALLLSNINTQMTGWVRHTDIGAEASDK